MVLIHNTNIVVDEFSFRNKNKDKNIIYFLTHMHTDHYTGMVDNWDHGPIYCTNTTKSIF